MSKIYEALQQAHREKKTSGKSVEVIMPLDLAHDEGVEMGQEMYSLYKVIEAMLPDNGKRVLQFMGSRPGEGTSTVVREFARIAADRIGRSVLLMDADRFQGTQSRYYSIASQCSWIDVLQGSGDLGGAIHRVGESELFVSPSCNSSVPTPELFNSPRFEGFWGNLRTKFDLVLIDSPPLTVSPDALALASKVDGVVLVVEAEKTKWRTVRYVRERIERVGGNILGIVFNKRRYYIPQSIYKYL
ncbi:MAG: CpsD/CapB family tyrosine-protein kinase [Syntrophobacteraceae bacterium]|jgi:capsular exopolysaccharide synthesis family protein